MTQPFTGEIKLFAGNFAPRGWAMCQGQLLSIAQYTTLYSLIGTTYGGDGANTFALPDFRGRAPVHQGQGSGLSAYVIGERIGSESVTLIASQYPAHSHPVSASTAAATQASPGGNLPGAGATMAIYSSSAPNVMFNAAAVSASGGSQPHSNLQPFLCLSFVIALEGIYPSQN